MSDIPQQRHVLFVDDEKASQRIVERMLRACLPDLRVTCVGDGARALGVLRREPVDLLITDLAMPVMDGIELLRQINNLRIQLPVIVVTAHGTPADETRALAWGAVEYFNKPIEVEPFVRSVQDLLEATVHRSHIEGVSIAGFVQLLTMERKTCALRASVAGAQGVLFFIAGALVDARQAELSGAPAALEIFSWKEPIITLEAHGRDRPATIHVGVTELLLESARLADERERNLRRSGAQGRSSSRGDPVSVTSVSRGPALSLVPSPRPRPRPTPVPTSLAEAETSFESLEEAAPAVEPSPVAAPAIVSVNTPNAQAAERPSPAGTSQEAATSRTGSAWDRPEAQVAIARLLAEAMKIDGATGAAVAHWELDHILGELGGLGGPTGSGGSSGSGGTGSRCVDAAAAGNCRVMRAVMAVMARLGLANRVQDLLITLDEHSHILWPLTGHEGLFLYLAVDRTRGNLALTRHRVQKLVEAQAL